MSNYNNHCDHQIPLSQNCVECNKLPQNQLAPAKKLKTLLEHNDEKREINHNLYTEKLNGIECPDCKREMFDHGAVTYASFPPKRAIVCSCGYSGFRLC